MPSLARQALALGALRGSKVGFKLLILGLHVLQDLITTLSSTVWAASGIVQADSCLPGVDKIDGRAPETHSRLPPQSS